jgi:hypothetical protein
MIGPDHDITSVPNAFGDTCTAADLLWPPIALPGFACPARVPPAPAGPVPNFMAINLGLDTAGVFTDDLDALSFGETAGTRVITDYDFSVDPAPANGGVTVGAPAVGCPAPNVTTEAAALEAQGDIFTTLGVPAGCNQVAPSNCIVPGPCDEGTLGLIAPNPAAPAVPPLDNVDAIAELRDGGTCFWGGIGRICPALSLTPGSATVGLAAPSPCSVLAPDGATIFVPPSAVPNPPCLPAGCPAGAGATACVAVPSASLGLLPGDDLDALCWFDRNGDLTVDLPTSVLATGDNYLFSLAPGSPTLAAGGFSAADILAPSAAGPVVSVPAAALGLLATDNIDGLTCHLASTDRDGDGYTDIVESGTPLCAGAANDDANVDLEAPAAPNDGCPALGAAEVACADAVDGDGDGLVNDGCPIAGALSEAAFNIGTNASDRCGVGPEAGPSAAWPPDFVSGGIFGSTDAVMIDDLNSFLAPRRLDTSPGDVSFSSRWDLVPGSGIFVTWINIGDLNQLLGGLPAFPPMLLGARALFGPLCTAP